MKCKYIKFWEKMTNKSLFKHTNKRGDKYYEIYLYCKNRWEQLLKQ